NFGDPAARAGARLIEDSDCTEVRSKWASEAIGAVAGSRTRTCALAQRHSPLKSQPRKLRSPGALLRSGALPFQQRTNTSCYLAIPTHGFTVVLSVFRGTPLIKPLNCKSVSNRLGPPSRLSTSSESGARIALRREGVSAPCGHTTP